MSELEVAVVAGLAVAGVSGLGVFVHSLVGREVARNDEKHAETRRQVENLDQRVAAVERTALNQAGVDASIGRLEGLFTAQHALLRASVDAMHQRQDRFEDRLFDVLNKRGSGGEG